MLDLDLHLIFCQLYANFRLTTAGAYRLTADGDNGQRPARHAGGGMSETWLYDEHPAMFRAHPLLFILLLVSVVGILAIGIWWLRCKGERLMLSEREVMMERGLLSRQRTEIALSSIRSVRITQTLGQRIFGVGHIELFSAGDYAEIAIKNMPRPDRIRAIAAARDVDLLPQR
jgi:membrane protein YdbS with pleckstrin-like domain